MTGEQICPGGDGAVSKFNLQIGFEGKMALAGRGLVFLRPFTLDMGLKDGTIIHYDVMFGGGVMF